MNVQLGSAHEIELALLMGEGYDQLVERFKKQVVTVAMEMVQGNQSQAARLLKTHRNNLVRWLKEERKGKIHEDDPNIFNSDVSCINGIGPVCE